MDSLDWPSLDDEVAVADALFGAGGRARVADWLAGKLALTGDHDVAGHFCEQVGLTGTAPRDYLHRFVRTSNGKLLGGIRFRGRDVNRPFVEIIAHGFDDLDLLADCVREEWSVFANRFLRLCTRPERFDGPKIVLDQGIYAARYRDLQPRVAGVAMQPFVHAAAAVDMVERCYRQLAQRDPELARNVSPAAPDDLRSWHTASQLRSITVGGHSVGLFAVAPGRIRWIEGDEITRRWSTSNTVGTVTRHSRRRPGLPTWQAIPTAS